MHTYRARRVRRADRGGSSWPVLVETDAGVFYTKLRGAAQAPASLVAEIIVGALAETLGLPVPPRVLIDIPADIPVDDPHQELAQLLRWSVGCNLGFEDSPRSTGWDVRRHVLHGRAARLAHVDEELAARLPRAVLESAVGHVPDDFMSEQIGEARRRRRAAYVAFLWKRLKTPRPFVASVRQSPETLDLGSL